MCGIIAYLGQDAVKYLYDGLVILQNRGYDSAGISTLQKSEIITSKYASNSQQSALEMLNEDIIYHLDANIGIAHTRWATHGPKTDKNAHPHHDMYNRITLVHNGIIENYHILKNMLLEKGYKFESDTDTEVISNLIGYYLDEEEDILKAIKRGLSQLEGTWGIVIMYKEDPDSLYICKKGSPIIVGYESDIIMVASEHTALSNYVNKYVVIDDNEIIRLRVNDNLLSKNYYERKIIQEENIKLSPFPYNHWMLKEIYDQELSSLRAMNMGGRFYDEKTVKLGGLMKKQEDLLKIEDLLILGCGTSYHAGILGGIFFRNLGYFRTVQVIDASEYNDNYITSDKMGILVLSQSGETKDLHRVLERINNRTDIIKIGVINVVGSLISRITDCGIYLNAGREVAVASTKSFTSQVIVLILISIWFNQNRAMNSIKREELIKQLRILPMNFRNACEMVVKQVDDSFVNKIYDKRDMYILGKGMGEAIAYEAALKIKEICYIHAEGYAGGGLKHGPFALIELGTIIFICVFNGEYLEKLSIVAEEVKARGAEVILVTDGNGEGIVYNKIIRIPSNGILSCVLGVVVFQYIAYKIALCNGYNPDYPRNLAKVVTVD